MNKRLLTATACVFSALLSAFLIGFEMVKGNVLTVIFVFVCLGVSIFVSIFSRKLKPQRIFEWCGIMVLIFIISLSVSLKSDSRKASTGETNISVQNTTENLVAKSFKVEIAKSNDLFETEDKLIENGETIKVEVKFECSATLTTKSIEDFIYVEGANYELLDENFTPERMAEDFTIKLNDITSEEIIVYIQPGLGGLISKERVLSEKSNELTYHGVVEKTKAPKVEVIEQETQSTKKIESKTIVKQPNEITKGQKVETPKVEIVEVQPDQTIEQPKANSTQDPTADLLPAQTSAPVQTPSPTSTPSTNIKLPQYYGDPTSNADEDYGDPTDNEDQYCGDPTSQGNYNRNEYYGDPTAN